MTAILKVDTIQDTAGNNIINENANTITIGKAGDTVNLAAGATQSGFGLSNWSESSGNLLPSNASYGIYLGVNSATASNLLDDYEEGTWTPVYTGTGVAGSYTYSAQVGTYTKIGRLVTVTCELNNITTVSGASGSLKINGLPFTSSSTSNGWGSVTLDTFAWTGYEYCVSNIGSSKNFVYIWKVRTGGTDGLLEPGDLTSGVSDLKFAISYEV